MYSINIQAQEGLFIGTSIGLYPEQSIRIQVDQQWKWVRQEYAVQINVKGEINVHAKMGFGVTTKRWDVFAYLPYMNLNINEGMYNTPFSAEFFFKKRRSKNWYDKPWFPNISACFDVYKNKMVPILRIKYRILH